MHLDGKTKNAPCAFADAVEVSQKRGMNNLRLYRELRGLSQSDLADMVGLNQSTIQRAEVESKTAKLHTYRLCAGALGVTLSDIFADSRSKFEARMIDLVRRIPSDRYEEVEAILRFAEARSAEAPR